MKTVKAICLWLGLLGFLVVLAAFAVLKLINPDMTELRFFYTFWWLWLILVGCVVMVKFGK